MNIALALGNCDWEAELVSHLSHPSTQLKVIRRCVDGIDLLAAIQIHQIDVVLISDSTLRFDTKVLEQLADNKVTVVAISNRPDNWNAFVQIKVIELNLKKLHLLPQQIHELAIESEIEEVAIHEPSGEITCVASFGGGVGRSLLAREIAYQCSLQGNPTLLVEADSFGASLAHEFDLPTYAIDLYSVYQSELFDNQIATGTNFLSVVVPNLAIIPGANVASSWLAMRKLRLDKMWLAMQQEFDVVVDTGPHFSPIGQEVSSMAGSDQDLAAKTVIAHAQKIIFCALASETSVLRLITGLIDNQEALRNHDISVVLNRCHDASTKDYSKLIERHTGVNVVAKIPDAPESVLKALQKRDFICRALPKSELAKELAKLSPLKREEPHPNSAKVQQERLSRTTAA